MNAHRISITAGTLLATATLAGAPAAAADQDLRSPDTRDAAARATQSRSQDLRSPDARDAAARATPSPAQDLRSPDARDAATRSTTPVVVQVGAPDAGFAWDSAAIGALAGAGLLISIAGGGVLITRRRPRAARPA
jgi:hypothetical protein